VLLADKQTLDQHLEDAEQEKPILADVRELMSQVSRRSLQWMMECVAFSPKTQVLANTAGPVRGLLGIGAAAFHQIANRGVLLTRPSHELAKQFWGSSIKADDIPVLRLDAPTTTRLNNLNSRYDIIATTESFKDSYGRPIKSGTIVQITELEPGLDRAFRPQAICDHLARRFGQDILDGRVAITIRGSLATDPSQARVREVKVLPVVHRGIPAVPMTTAYLNPDRQEDPFELEVFYNPSGRGSTGLMLRRLGSDVLKLTELPEFQVYPWNLPLSGYVEFPAVSESRARWNPDKTTPLPSKTYEEWQLAVQAFALMIENVVKELEAGVQNQRLKEYAVEAEQATTDALRELPAFQDILWGTVRRKGGKGTGIRTPRVEDRVIAAVVNEHGRGIQGVTIELLDRISNPIETRTTGKSGTVSFGRFDLGYYTLRVTGLPKDMRLDGAGEQRFRLTRAQPGIRETFRVITGEPKPEVPRIPTVRIDFVAWDDIGTLYRTPQFRDLGIIDVNLQADGVRDAVRSVIDDGDYERLDVIVAQVEAAVITMNTLDGDNAYLFHENVRLAMKLHEHLRHADASRKRRSHRQRQVASK